MTVVNSILKNQYVNLVLLLLLFLASELFIFPNDAFPINDDWSYTYSVQHLNDTGKIDIGYWPAMSLVSHIWWGELFVSMFGFSHFVLRCSTLFLSFFTLLIFYRMVFSFSKDHRISFFSCLFLFFNPLFFLLANTFMTDVPFLFSLVLAFYCIEKIVVQKKNIYLLWFSLSCVYSLLMRQFGLVLSVSFLLVFLMTLVAEKRNVKQFLMYSIPFVLSLTAYLIFEKWVVNHLPPNSAYQSADSVTKDVGNVFFGVADNIVVRYSYTMLYIGLFLCPLCVLAALSIVRNRSLKQMIVAIVMTLVLVILALNRITVFPLGNMFYNSGVGVETLYDTAILNINAIHSSSGWFPVLVRSIAFMGLVCFAFVVATGLSDLASALYRKQSINKMKMVLFIFSVIYFLLLCVSKAFFDRYTLPLIAISIFLLVPYLNLAKLRLSVVAGFVVLMAYFSVFATNDYFNWNRARWQLINTTIKRGVKPAEINGGFEYVASTFYHDEWWDLWGGETSPYKISFGPIPKHDRVNYVSYQRYIPYRMDTVFLSRRQ